MKAERERGPGVAPIALSRPALEDLNALARARGVALASVYLPVRAAFPGAQENALRLRAARETVSARLLAEGLDAAEAEQRTAPLARIVVDPREWTESASALAAFIGPGLAHAFALPEEAPERVYVADSFALLALARAIQRDPRYRVLALSANRVAFFEGDARGLAPRAFPGVPTSLEDALGSELGGHELSSRSGTGPEVGHTARFYATHSANQERGRDLERFHTAVAGAVERAIGASTVPLVLATDETNGGRFRKLVRLPALLDETLTGNADVASPKELHARSWPIVQAELERRAQALHGAWERARNHGKGLTALDRIVAAAVGGRVRRLWVEEGAAIAGRLDTEGLRVVPCDGRDGDVLEALAAQVLAHAGEVIVAESGAMPAPAAAAAELR
jgi:hypothetical protein